MCLHSEFVIRCNAQLTRPSENNGHQQIFNSCGAFRFEVQGSEPAACGAGASNRRHWHSFEQRGADMKVNIEIDCTPLEARQFFGLPDVSPMQIAVMEKLQEQMMANIEKVTPEALMQTWFTFDPKLAERFQDMFVTMAGLGGSRSIDKKK
jgi:hypothetical protein